MEDSKWLQKRCESIFDLHTRSKAESKEKHGVWDPYMPESTIPDIMATLQSRHQHIYHGQPYARVDRNPMLVSTLSPTEGL